MAAVQPLQYNIETTTGRELAEFIQLLREVHMRLPHVYARLTTIGDADALEAATAELGLVSASDGATGAALLDLMYALDQAITDPSNGISVADVERAFQGEVLQFV